MNDSPLLERILSMSVALNHKALLFGELPQAQTLSLRLERAMESHREGCPDRPVCIALMGGTGVGKSELFNALIGHPQSSPSSPTRPTTVRPHVAASPADRPFLSVFAESGAVFVDGGRAGIVVVDTPDLDSVVTDHLETAGRLIAAADVVVYVSSPDKRSNFKILEQVRAWSAQKRWFFVLNKMDQIAEPDRESVIDEFMLRLREVGFLPDPTFLFPVSATKPETGSFARFKEALFSFKAVEQVRALRCEALLNRVLHALSEDVTRPLEEKRDVLIERESELTQRVRGVIASALASAQTGSAIRHAVLEQAWRLAPGRIGGFLALPVWLRSRLAFSGMAFQLARMASSGPSLVRMARAGWSAARAAWRGMLPVEVMLRGFAAPHAGKLSEIALDSQRVLQDMGLTAFLQTAGMNGIQAGHPSLEQGCPPWARRLLSLVTGAEESEIGSSRADEWNKAQVRERLEHAIEDCAARTVFRRLGRMQSVLGNLLPTLVFGHAAFRLGQAWLSGVWMPLEFYLSAAAVFSLSLVPGYFLVSTALSRRGELPDIQELVDSIERPQEIAGLCQARSALEDLTREIKSLREQVLINIRVLHQELDPSTFGVSLMSGEQQQK